MPVNSLLRIDTGDKAWYVVVAIKRLPWKRYFTYIYEH